MGLQGCPPIDVACVVCFCLRRWQDQSPCALLFCGVLQVAAQQGAYVARMINRGYTMGMCWGLLY